MKRILSMLMTLALALAAPAALAEAALDFSGYSYDELIGIRQALDAELGTRPEAGERVLQPGQYTVGLDIAQGIYDVSFVPAEENVTYSNWYVYDTRQMYDYDVGRLFLGDMPRQEGRVQEGGSVKVELLDGDCFVVYRSALSIERTGNAARAESDYVAPEGTVIPTGIYMVGDEIPVGKYTIFFNGVAPSRVRAYANPEDATNDFVHPEFEVILTDSNTSAEINLKEGYAFRLEYNNIIMRKSEGFVFD